LRRLTCNAVHVSSAATVERKLLGVRSPFTRRAGRPLLVHCSHHKVGTVWFKRVLKAVADSYGLRFEAPRHDRPSDTTEVVFFDNAYRFKHEYVEGRSFRGSHIVRDPRDLVVSAYHYHLRTTEAWALEPSDEWDGKSYRDYLGSLNAHDGLMAEITRSARSGLASMGTWDYNQPEFLELRYENVLRDEASAFESLFRHYGFRSSECSASVETARRFSLDVVRGHQDEHVRSGQPGEWRSAFEPSHSAHFKELTGDLVVRLGYENTTDW
jgi:hypothetical protein